MLVIFTVGPAASGKSAWVALEQKIGKRNR
jgi:hypothetical protein